MKTETKAMHCIFGIPEGLEACKMYKCYFTGNDFMTIVDYHNNFKCTLVINRETGQWETSLKKPIVWAKEVMTQLR